MSKLTQLGKQLVTFHFCASSYLDTGSTCLTVNTAAVWEHV